MNKYFLLIYLTLIIASPALTQNLTQTVKGKVYDRDSHISLPGATVIVAGTDPLIGTTTDGQGRFTLTGIPLGRIDLKISFIGYDHHYVSGLLLSSSEEAVVDIPLKEKVTGLKEVVIKDDFDKDKALNSMATLSARSVSLEESQRFAGGMEDFSRLVAAFGGVSPSSIDNNEIIIRGNPAKGILWRLEGVEIPVPNHLAHAFNSGGVVSMFSPFMMANSDFFTGAFPAEYGNVLSGVFDINFRTGNPDKRKYAVGIGGYGIDFAAEGPFKKGKPATYLANFRVSTTSLLKQVMPVETGLPDYADLAFNLDFPTKKAGVFSLWSLNGFGRIAFSPTKEPVDWENSWDNIKYNITYGMSATGLNHKVIIGKKSYLSSSLSFSMTENTNVSGQLDSLKKESQVADISESNYSVYLKSMFNHKFSARHTNRSGLMVNYFGFNYNDLANTNPAIQDTLDFVLSDKGAATLFQLYSQSKYQLSSKWMLNAGLHFMFFGLNGNFSIEPRIGLGWQVAPKHRLGIAYGKHSRIEPLRIYLISLPAGEGEALVNKDLQITKAHHFVLGYDWNINVNLHFKIEPYFQLLYDVPVIPDSSFSMINYQNDMFFNSKLNNSGTGTNVGVDLTFERFMSNNYYYMFTASVYQSKYKEGDGIERNTRLNQNYVFNVLGGKEWKVRENNFLSINGKFTVLGGMRYTSPDQAASQEYQSVVYDYSRIYEDQWHTNYYLDFSLNYRINRSRVAHIFIIQAKNLTMQKELIGFAYNYKDQVAEPIELAVILPYVSYKIEF